MKKSKKLGALALCAIVSASTLAVSPEVINIVKADSAPTLQIPALQKTYSIDEQGYVVIPELKSEKLSTKVYALGSDVEIEDEDTDDTHFKFKPSAKQYSVVYTNKESDTSVTSKTFIISIDYEDATFTLDESSVIIPETTVKNVDVLLPYPTLKDSDGNVISLDYAQDVTITVSNKAKNNIEVLDSDKDYKENVKYKKFTPANPGTYTVKYKVNKQGYDEITKSYTIKVEPSMQTEAEISFKLNGSLPTLTLNKECTLPTVTATDKTNELENIKVRVDLSYYILAQDGTASNETKIVDYKFTPKQEGYYVFKYKVTDAFGNESKTQSFKIQTKVVDTEAPIDLIIGGSYKVGEDGEAYILDGETVTSEKIYDLSCKIPTNVNTNTDFVIPAVFAKDNDDFSKLTFTRTLKRYENGQVVETIDLGEDGNDCTKLITKQVENAGSYKLLYKVADSKGNETSVDYDITVYAGTWVDTVAPTISWTGDVDSSVKWGTEVKVSKPSSSDLNDAGLIGDLNIENVMKYYYSYKEDGTDKTTEETLVQLNSSKKYVVKTYSSINAFKEALGIALEKDVTDVELCFKYTSIDDNANNFSDTKKISIIGATEIPTVEYTQAPISATQGQEITLSDVVINYSSSNFDEYLKDIDVGFEIINRESKTPMITYGSSYTIADIGGVQKLTVSGAKFLATLPGNYDIVLTVTDVNGNTFVTSAAIENVAEVTNNGRIELDKTEMTLELGSTDTSAKIYTLWKNGSKIAATDDNIKITVVDDDPSNPPTVTIDSNKNIVAKSIGVSTIKYTMYTEDGLTEITSKTITVTVKDTEKPEMSFSEDNPFSDIYKADDVITLPTPVVSDKSGINSEGIVIKVTHNGSNVTITEDGGVKKFTATEDGTYSVEYKVTDMAGNTTSKTFTVSVGDLEGPVVDVKNVPASKEVGSIYTVSMSDLVIYDEYEENFEVKLGENTFITLKDAAGNEIKSLKDGEYSYKLESAGSYTLTIKSTDSSNKTTTIDKTIIVSEAEPEPASTSMAGTVIAIIGALALLGFVIYWFFKPEKASPSKKNKQINKPKNSKEGK